MLDSGDIVTLLARLGNMGQDVHHSTINFITKVAEYGRSSHDGGSRIRPEQGGADDSRGKMLDSNIFASVLAQLRDDNDSGRWLALSPIVALAAYGTSSHSV